MPRKRAGRSPKGTGTIRQRKDGTWEGRYIAGRNPATGKVIRKSIYAKTQGEIVEQLRKIQTALTDGTFTEPSKMTVAAWLDIWAAWRISRLYMNHPPVYNLLLTDCIM